MNDFSYAVLGLLEGVAAATFIAAFRRPRHAGAVRSGLLAGGFRYTAIDGPLLILTGEDPGAAVWLTLLGLSLVIAASAFGAALGLGMATALGWNQGRSDRL